MGTQSETTKTKIRYKSLMFIGMGLLLLGVVVTGALILLIEQVEEYNIRSFIQRTPLDQRRFNSSEIERVIDEMWQFMDDKKLAAMFEQNFPNTLDKTVEFFGIDPETNRYDTFIVAGDIKVMWNRDSTNQVIPYLPYLSNDQNLDNLIVGLINRQIKNVLLDPFANVFFFNQTEISPFKYDYTTILNATNQQEYGLLPGVWERKFGIDSLASVLKLQVMYVESTGKKNASFMHKDYFKSLELIYEVLTDMQLGTLEEDLINRAPYTFRRYSSNPFDTTNYGRGNICTGQDGMAKSFFRPSDDACAYGYFVPGNAMLVTYLSKTADIIASQDLSLSQKLHYLSKKINHDIYSRGLTKDKYGNHVFAYEIDGFGNALKVDDANVPSLLSLPYLGFVKRTDPLYLATRRMVLDPEQNPYFFSGPAGEGIGSPRTGSQHIWIVSVITRAITSEDDAEIIKCLNILKSTTLEQHFINQSFYENDILINSRPSLSYVYSYFSELLLDLYNRKPHILKKI